MNSELKVSPSVEPDQLVTFRRSIWEFDERYQKLSTTLSEQDLADIASLQSVEASKKRTPPAPLIGLLGIARALRSLPDELLTEARFLALLREQLLPYGIGLKTATCMLAVFTDGKYPPMDDKISKGLFAMGVISESEHAALNSASESAFATPYIAKVLPEWLAARAHGALPKAIDHAWANCRRPQA
jgi:hypothetical protein